MDVTELVRQWRERDDGPAELAAHHVVPAREARLRRRPASELAGECDICPGQIRVAAGKPPQRGKEKA